MTRPIAALTIVLLGAALPAPASAYLKFGVRVGGAVIDIRWNRPVPYFVTERGVPGVSAAEFRDAVTRAFATWQRVPGAQVQTQFQGFTIAPPALADGRTTLGFLDRPDLDRVLGSTSFLLDGSTGEILESDVFFNANFDWSVAPGGSPGRTDLESIALHEIGHLLGLGHSGLGETEMVGGGRRVLGIGAIMFPIALSPGVVAGRELQADDRAGISDLYPAPDFATTTSSISGRVTRDGRGVFGAHVAAFNLRTGTLVGGFSLSTQGDYVIAGLEPGVYVVRAEPLDDADPEAFFVGPIDVDFRVGYGARPVVAPRGGTSDPIDIAVRAK